MEEPKTSEEFLAALRNGSVGRARLVLKLIDEIFLKSFPHLQGAADRRERLRELLLELAEHGLLRLPANKRHGWERAPSPPLPKWVLLFQEPVQRPPPFNHRAFPWVSELAFVASLRSLKNPDEILRIHEFLKSSGRTRPLVPVKERSYELFGDEKRLDSLRKSVFFVGLGRLTLELLRCQDVPATLSCVPGPVGAPQPWLIVENEATFHSFCRANRIIGRHKGIVLGSGNAVLRASEFLKTLVQPGGGSGEYLYFGDVDEEGISIAQQLNKLLNQADIVVRAADLYYCWLFESRDIRASTISEETALLGPTWFPQHLRSQAALALQQSRPVVQEAVGWEFIVKKFGISGDIPF